MTSFQIVEIRDASDAIAPGESSAALQTQFKSLVYTNLTAIPWPESTIHRVLFARPPSVSGPIAFCYYFLIPGLPANGQLFGVFVDDQFRRQGLACELLTAAARDLYDKGCRAFDLRFTAEDADGGQLVAALRSTFLSGFTGAVFTFFFRTHTERLKV